VARFDLIGEFLQNFGAALDRASLVL